MTEKHSLTLTFKARVTEDLVFKTQDLFIKNTGETRVMASVFSAKPNELVLVSPNEKALTLFAQAIANLF